MDPQNLHVQSSVASDIYPDTKFKYLYWLTAKYSRKVIKVLLPITD